MNIRAGDRVGTPDYDHPDGWVLRISPRIGEGSPTVASDVVVLHDGGLVEEWPVMGRSGECALRRVKGAPRLSWFDHPVPSVEIVPAPRVARTTKAAPRRRKLRRG